MYSFKTLLWRLYEEYSNNMESKEGMAMLMDGWAFAYSLKTILSKQKPNIKEVNMRNKLLINFFNYENKNNIILIKKQINKDIPLIDEIIWHITKNYKYSPELDDTNPNRIKYIEGSIGVVVE